MPEFQPMLEVENMTLCLSGRRILKDINLSIGHGEFLGVIGPNGGGKTSLLRLLLGIIEPSEGRVRWGLRATEDQPRIGYVPQRNYVDRSYPLSAREIVRQGSIGACPLFGKARREAMARAEELLSRFGLEGQTETSYVHLSGGEQRRCLLARALMNAPSILLLDEPTAGVDIEGQRQFCKMLSQLSKEGITVVLVSHDIPLISQYAQRIACVAETLHWHGDADSLEQQTVANAYHCEYEKLHLPEQPSTLDMTPVCEPSR